MFRLSQSQPSGERTEKDYYIFLAAAMTIICEHYAEIYRETLFSRWRGLKATALNDLKRNIQNEENAVDTRFIQSILLLETFCHEQLKPKQLANLADVIDNLKNTSDTNHALRMVLLVLNVAYSMKDSLPKDYFTIAQQFYTAEERRFSANLQGALKSNPMNNDIAVGYESLQVHLVKFTDPEEHSRLSQDINNNNRNRFNSDFV